MESFRPDIVELGVAWGLVTQFTSFIAVDEKEENDKKEESKSKKEEAEADDMEAPMGMPRLELT